MIIQLAVDDRMNVTLRIMKRLISAGAWINYRQTNVAEPWDLLSGTILTQLNNGRSTYPHGRLH